VFYGDKVTISLSDGRTMNLPQTISADGGRYANTDDSFVFWNKGNTAFITENGTTTFSNCITAQN
ncbi:MAG TPA: MliC family protein, partial [Candidatus Paceibacterota bacterium]|nr:MliC family protein [Candidatus Paceibacterota bacterium]